MALGSAGSTVAPASPVPGATPIPAPRTFAYVSRDSKGAYTYKIGNVDTVCPTASTQPCGTGTTVESHAVALSQDASTVIGSPDGSRIIVANDPSSADRGTISVVSLASADPGPTSTPTPTDTTASATPSPVDTPSLTPTKPPASGSAAPIVTPTPPASPSPSPSVAVTPSGQIEIAHNVVLVGQSAAYSTSGLWFAFTARPADGSAGPDIFVWKVGDQRANRVTSDHRSVLGSWAGDVMVGSTVAETTKGNGASA